MFGPVLLKDICKLEKVLKKATKFILGSTLNYKHHLIKLKLLPLMYFLELTDTMFLVTSLKSPSTRFNIQKFVNSKIILIPDDPVN